jgi:hypothetical protein
MHERRAVLLAFACAFLFALVPVGLHAQSATSGLVQGVVKDPTGAVIPGATVALTEKATNVTIKTTTDATGHYLFPAVSPGDYSLRITATGFQSYVVANLVVEVTKSYNVSASLKIGTAAQTVTVTEVPGAELQTTNASVGTTIAGNTLQFLPTAQRSVTSLLSLQPAVIPELAADDVYGGQVAGALSDQTTFLVDGGDATDDLSGTSNYSAVPGQPEPAPAIQVNVAATQEFRVVTGSPTSGFARSQGGEVAIVSKRGTNQFHGSLYEYYTGSALGANSWTNNSIGLPKPHRVNNRFGFTLGGPILKNKLFFFGNYEGRRFRESQSVGTDVPTYCARNGILRFTNGNGQVQSYNFDPNLTSAVASQCGVAMGTPVSSLDPLGVGIDPTIQKYWANEPLPNLPGSGDGLNSEEFLQSYSTPTNENYGMARIDYSISQRWHLYGTFRYQKMFYNTTDQIDIIPGQQGLLSGTPVQPRFVTFMLTGQIGNNFTTQTHGSFLRDWWAWNRAPLANPSNVPGIAGTLQVSGEGQTGGAGTGKPFADPINFNTQQARGRLWAAKDWYLAEDDSWLHGNHNIQFGGAWYFWNIIHQRTDDILGGLTNGPIYWVQSRHASSGSFVNTSASEMPQTCSTSQGILTNCILSSDAGRYESMYSAMLGLVDHSSQVAARNGNFQAYPLGTPMTTHVHVTSYYTYIQDMWQVRPSITVNYGVNWGLQLPPRALDGKQAIALYTSSLTPVTDINAYFNDRQAAMDSANWDAIAGLNNFSFSPIRHVSGMTRPIKTYWGQFGPRFGVAWQPPFHNRFFGNRQTVLRAGYSLVWNRTNAVGLVMTPLTGTGMAQIVGCNGPVWNSTTGDPCSGGSTTAADAFRIGEAKYGGNSLPMPTPTSGYPVTTPGGLGTTYNFSLDPNYSPAYSHQVSVDLQRTFPQNWMIDIGYIGRFTRNLENGADINASDMFAKDPVSGQTLAQAFDAVSTYFRNGGNCTVDQNGVASCPGLQAQPFFENMAVNGQSAYGTDGTAYCQAEYGSNCTWAAAAGDPTDASNGGLGEFMTFNYDFLAQQSMDPLQFVYNFWNYGGGWANYNAGFISVHKAFSQGLSLTFNYTLSHALGTQALNQQYIIYGNPSPFDPQTGYATALFDRRNVFNATYYYTLPFGHGQKFSFANSFLNRIVGGWFSSGIWTWQSGQPLCIAADGEYGDYGAGAVNQTCAQTTMNLYGLQGRHNNVVGANGVGITGDPAAGGSGINIFANPSQVFSTLSRPLLTQNLSPFDPNFVEPSSWNIDLSVGKNIVATERYKAIFTADFFDAFNIFTPADPSLDMNNPAAFGVVTGQANSPRTIQLGLDFEF